MESWRALTERTNTKGKREREREKCRETGTQPEK